MRLPAIKRIIREDIKDAPAWVNGIINPVNSFMEAVYQTLNKNVSLGDNVASSILEFDYITPSTYPSDVATVKFMNQLKARAIGVVLLQIYDKSNYSAPAGPVYIPWVMENDSIVISTITGLAASKSYLVRVVVF